MTQATETFTTHVRADLLVSLRELAVRQGRPLHLIVDEALEDLVAKYHLDRPRGHVLDAHLGSYDRFAELYRRLAR